jgi:hypothetical protein
MRVQANRNDKEILRLLSKGYTLNHIHQITGARISYLEKNFSGIINKRSWKILGHKSEPYYKTESEMYERMHAPLITYNDLSPSEKAIYDEMADDN